MRKKIFILLSFVVFSLLPSCNAFPEESTEEATPGYEVYNTIEGEYVVSYLSKQNIGESLEYTVIGRLVLNEGKFSFKAEKGVVIPEDIYERLSFVPYPRGKYELNFRSLENPEDLAFENLLDHKINTLINFIPSKRGDKGNALSYIFYIFFDEENEVVYFHGIFSEFQFWKVEKHWDV